jgi:hypothetical protein
LATVGRNNSLACSGVKPVSDDDGLWLQLSKSLGKAIDTVVHRSFSFQLREVIKKTVSGPGLLK